MSESGIFYNNALHGEIGKYFQGLFYPLGETQHRNYFYLCMGFYSFVCMKEGFMVVFKFLWTIEN